MATTRRLRRVGFAAGALVCVAAATGCRTLTIPWEHPTAFKQTPACDSPGQCGNGCYVPPPPMLDSDCYGYRFTCWHPWPEHCQPQCNDGCQPVYATVAPQPVDVMPTTPEPTMPEPTPPESLTPMPPLPPMTPPTAPPSAAPEMPPEETSFAPPGSATTRNAARYENARPVAQCPLPPGGRYAAAERSAAVPSSANWSREMPSYATSTPRETTSANYGFLNAVAQSPGAIHDESVRPASRVTRLYAPGEGPDAQSNSQRQPPPNAEERFRW